jgi:hypothetical protein
VVESAGLRHRTVKGTLAGVPEGRMAEIVGKGQGFGQILVKIEGSGESPRNLGDFKRVSQPGSVVIAFVIEKHLGFLLQSAKSRRMDNAVAVALEICARRTWIFDV